MTDRNNGTSFSEIPVYTGENSSISLDPSTQLGGVNFLLGGPLTQGTVAITFGHEGQYGPVHVENDVTYDHNRSLIVVSNTVSLGLQRQQTTVIDMRTGNTTTEGDWGFDFSWGYGSVMQTPYGASGALARVGVNSEHGVFGEAQLGSRLGVTKVELHSGLGGRTSADGITMYAAEGYYGGSDDAPAPLPISNRPTPRPSDAHIQESRDIVAGKKIDPSTGQRVYADAAIRAVTAAQTKREQEIAAAYWFTRSARQGWAANDHRLPGMKAAA